MVRKAQGALEFLMTYAWAFLLIIIVIGALVYFGVLTPSRFLPERCMFGTEFTCKAYSLVTDGSTADINIQLQNNVGEAIYIYLLETTFTTADGFNSNNKCIKKAYDRDGNTIAAYGTTATVVEDGQYFELSATGCNELGSMTLGEKYKLDVVVGYYAATSSNTFTHKVNGEVYTNVEET